MPYRRIWLPVIALLLPTVFVGLLGYRWLALEQDAAARRGVQAAEAAATALTNDLRIELRSAALAVAPVLEEPETRRAVFKPPPDASPLISNVFLFDRSGRLLYPAFDASTLGEMDRSAEAAGLLLTAREAYASNQLQDAELHVRRIWTCCPAARDEYGMSYLLYAAWQRVSSHAGRSDTAGLARLDRDLREAIDAGYLGRREDVTALSLIAKQAHGATDTFLELTERLTGIRDDADRRAAAARAGGTWLASVGPEATDGAFVLGVHRAEGTPTLMAATGATTGHVVVMTLDAEALDARVAEWATTHSSFDMRVSLGPERSLQALLVVPLFREAPMYDLVVALRPSDPAVDIGRGRLFAAALIAALALTLLLGTFAVRDVTREIGTGTMRSAFVASVTHELKTPVASIRLLAETLRQGRARPERTNELLDTIVEESDRLAGLVDNALTSSRIEAGAQVYRLRSVAPGAVVRAAVRRFESALARKQVELVLDIEDDLVVSADPEALERAVLNLLDNAVKHAGGNGHIRVAVRGREGRADINVTDQGPGVPPSERARIFDRFYRSPAAVDTAGAGLGLALVRHFARAHGGHAEVLDGDGRGSVFVISIPLSIDAQDSDR